MDDLENEIIDTELFDEFTIIDSDMDTDLKYDDKYINNAVLDNFPYLEDDFDSITDYQLFSKGFEYLDNKKANKDEIPSFDDVVTKDTKDLVYYTKTSDLATVALTGDYDDLSNKPTIPDVSNFITKDVNNLTYYTKTSDLATVALSGDYDDLSNKPTIPDVSNFITKDVNNLTYYTKTSDLSTVALSGDYDDLSNKPTIPDMNNYYTKTEVNGIQSSIVSLIPTKTSDLNNDSNFITLSDVPRDLSDYVNDEGFITKDVNNLTNYTKTSDLATVAISGDYDDLSNKPTIPDVSNFITIDSGSNSNGNYIKYSNGDMIQTGTIECSGGTNYGTITFPVAFINNSYNLIASNIYTSGSDYGGTLQLRCISTPQSYNTTTGYIYSVTYDGTAPSFKRKINWIAVGKWK